MKYIFILLTLWGLSSQAQSVSDTTYYDRQWKKCARDSFTFYRTVHTKKDLYLVTDHYHDGTVQMQGSYSSLDPEIRNGFFTYYFATGLKQEEGEYYNGKKRGTFRYYSNSTGQLKSAIEYLNDKKNGSATVYLSDGGKVQSFYRDNILISSRTEPVVSKDKRDAAQRDDPRNPEGEQSILATIIRIKFDLSAPDSLQKKHYKVTVSFEVDTDGTIYNIRPVYGGNRWLNDLVIQSIKELPDLKSYGKTANGFTDAVYSFTVTFPQISIDKSTTMEYRSTAGSSSAPPPPALDAFSKGFFNSMKNNNGSLPDTLKKNVRLYLSDSLQQVAWTVRVTYDIDSTGRAENITVGQENINQLSDVVVQTIKEVHVSGSTKQARSKNTLTVAFPSLSISEQSTSENGSTETSTTITNGKGTTNTNSSVNSSSPDKLAMSDSLSAMFQKLGEKVFSSSSGGGLNQKDMLTTYFRENYQQTSMASDTSMHGSVMVKFEVDEKGKPSSIELIWGQDKKLEDFVMKMIKKYKDWTPRMLNGKAVKTIFRISIHFPDINVVNNSDVKPE